MSFHSKVALLGLLLGSSSVNAFPFILSAWQQKYEYSFSDQAGCLLCHVELNGGDGWNEYGWRIRQELRDQEDNATNLTTDQAFANVEIFDHDNDPLALESIDEIRGGFQPGWTTASTNSFFLKNGSIIQNQAPPLQLDSNSLDFPAAIDNPIVDVIPSASTILDLTEIAGGFNAPVRAVKAPGINGSLFVVEQTGKIFRVDLASGNKTLFHDVSQDLVTINSGYDERGLLGLAFHPDYQSNGLFYTYQSEPRRTEQNEEVDFEIASTSSSRHRSMIVEYKASNSSCNSSISKRKNVMILDQPQGNHNGGDLVFDEQGMLYIAIGDGGNANDIGPGHGITGNGRNANNVLGTILRIDPLGDNSANQLYGIPNDNPFIAAADERVDEIFAYGLRNPYRMSFDSQTNELYAGDVGQNDLEEINIIVNGGNYGWNWKEGGFYFYNPPGGNYVSNVAPPGLPNDLVDPIGQYDRQEGISVIGGYVYRGSTLDGLAGSYIFGDYVGSSPGGMPQRLFKLGKNTGTIEAFRTANPISGFVTGFGQDADKELYVLTNETGSPASVEGKLIKLVEQGDVVTFPDSQGESAECPVGEYSLCLPVLAPNGKTTIVCL